MFPNISEHLAAPCIYWVFDTYPNQVRKNNKKSTQQTLKVKVILKNPNAKSEETEEAAVAKITSAVQLSPESAKLTFDSAVSLTKDNLAIYLNDAATPAYADSIDKKSDTEYDVVYTFNEKTTNDTDYTYTFKAVNEEFAGEASFTTGSYAITEIVVPDQTVRAGVLDPVTYTLKAGEIDVTKYSDYLDYVVVEFGDNAVAQINTATAPKVELDNVGDKTTMTVSYKGERKDADLKEGKGTITAVKPTATEAKFYKIASWQNTKLAYILKDDAVENVSVTLTDGVGTTDGYYFAVADDASALGYYAVEYSTPEYKIANEDIVDVSVDNVTDRCYKITFTGLKKGNTTVTFKFEENLNASEAVYNELKVNVTVTEYDSIAKNLVLGATTIARTNAADDDYQKEDIISAKLVNASGTVVAGTYTFEAYSAPSDTDLDKLSKAIEGSNPTTVNNPKGHLAWDHSSGNDAWAAVDCSELSAGTYRIKIEASGEGTTNQNTFTKYVTLSVKDVTSYYDNVSVANTKFKITDSGDRGLADGGWLNNAGTEFNVRLSAFNTTGQFVGYVRVEDDSVKVGTSEDKATLSDGKNLWLKVSRGGQYYQVHAKSGDVTQQRFALGEASHVNSSTKAVSSNYLNLTKAAVSSNSTRDLTTVSILDANGGTAYFFGAADTRNVGLATQGTYTITLVSGTGENGIPGKETRVASVTFKVDYTGVTKLESGSIDYDAKASEGWYVKTPYALLVEEGTLKYAGSGNNEEVKTGTKDGKDVKEKLYAKPYSAAKIAVTKAESESGTSFSTETWLKADASGTIYAAAVTAPGFESSKAGEMGSVIYVVEHTLKIS